MPDTMKAFILGLVQGLAEFLPVSSSGHIELGKVLLRMPEAGLEFAVLVHIATALSTIVVFRRDLFALIQGAFSASRSDSVQQIGKLAVSAIPVGMVGVLFKEKLQPLFSGNLTLVGVALLLTSGLLFLTSRIPRQEGGQVTWAKALLIGLAQMMAIVPGISRSGATISTALFLRVDPVHAARFSFLMVLIPILGAAVLDLFRLMSGQTPWSMPAEAALTGFFTAFLVGIAACSAMLRIVRQGKLYWFGLYCMAIGLLALGAGLMT